MHILYIPPRAMAMEEAASHGTSMMLMLSNFNLSMRLAEDHVEAAVEAAVRKAMLETKQVMPELRGQLYDIGRGYPLVKKSPSTGSVPAPPEASLADMTLDEVKNNRQQVLAPLTQVPGAKVTPGINKRASRSSNKDEASQAAELE